MAELNINNLELDDNINEVLPDGDYHFTLVSHEVEYSTSDKFPANTQVIVAHFEVPYIGADGIPKTAKVRSQFPVAQRMLWKIRQLVECIGMAPEKGKVRLDLDKIDGTTGVFALVIKESAKGNEFNDIQTFYTPSKAPIVTANDEAWKKKVGFMEAADELGLPFD